MELMNVLRETETTGPGAKLPDGNPIRFVDMHGQAAFPDTPPVEVDEGGMQRVPKLEIEISSSTGNRYQQRDSDITAGSHPNLSQERSSEKTFSSQA